MSKPSFQIKMNRFEELTSKFKAKKILIVGDVGLDRYTIGMARRLSPEAPVPVVAVSSQKDKLGMAANVADNVVSFGAIPALASVIGKDRAGAEFLELVESRELASELLLTCQDRRTSLKERVIAQNQQVVRIDHEVTQEITEDTEERFLQLILPQVEKFDAVIFEDYAKGVLTEKVVREIAKEAKKKGTLVTFDPTEKVRPLSFYHGITLFKPNDREAENISRMDIKDQKGLAAVGEFFLRETQASMVVVTQGPQGMTLFSKDQKPIHIPTFARAVYDVSGAGDTVISMLTLALVAGASLQEAAVLANYAAGVEVGKPGTATVSIEELKNYMSDLGGLS